MTATLGSLIRQRRIEMGLTQEQLAERVGNGVRQAEISRLERDRITLPRRARLEQIARALEIPVGVLLARSGWIGADVALNASAAEPAIAARETPGADVRMGDAPSSEEPAIVTEQRVGELPHLLDAISRAQDLTLRAREVIEDARDTFERAQQVHHKRGRRANGATRDHRP